MIRAAIYHSLLLADQFSLFFDFYELPIVNASICIVFCKGICVIVVSIGENIELLVWGWKFSSAIQLVNHVLTSFLCPFSNCKRHKKVGVSLYACVNPCVTFFRPSWALTLNFLLFFLTMLHNSSHSNGVSPTFFMR